MSVRCFGSHLHIARSHGPPPPTTEAFVGAQATFDFNLCSMIIGLTAARFGLDLLIGQQQSKEAGKRYRY